jgi:hypothetical protein
MTRAFKLLLGLRFGEAFDMHPLFPLVFVVFGGIIAVTAKPELKENKLIKISCYVICVIFLAVYIIRMALFFPDNEPLKYFWGSIAGRIITALRG